MADRSTNETGPTMPLGDHLEDLRRRLILALVGLAPIAVGSLVFGRSVLAWLSEPLREELRKAGQPPVLIQTGVLEAFGSYMQLSIVAAVLIGSPWMLYQLWKFVAPGLYPRERAFVHFLVPFSAFLTVAGAAFLYFFVLPVILAFFIDFGTGLGGERPGTVELPPGLVLPEIPLLGGDPVSPKPGQAWVNTVDQQLRLALDDGRGGVRVLGSPLITTAGVVPQLRVREYLSTVLNLALAFAVAFQTPIVVLLLGWTRILDRRWLRRHWRYPVMTAAVLGAVLTPADPLSMVMLAIPLYMLYEGGMLLLMLLPPGGRGARGLEPDGDADGSVGVD